jgi:hypothetical protein
MILAGNWRHYKGGVVKVDGTLKSCMNLRDGQKIVWHITGESFTSASDIKEGQEVVVYRHGRKLYWRSKENFLGSVEGQKRFTKL